VQPTCSHFEESEGQEAVEQTPDAEATKMSFALLTNQPSKIE
jgi:hypothetical protein